MVNLFYLDKNPKTCAKYYCDKHVNKIMIEIAQILSQVHHNTKIKLNICPLTAKLIFFELIIELSIYIFK